MKPSFIVVDVETTGLSFMTDRLHGIGVLIEGEATASYYLADAIPDHVRSLLADPTVDKVGHNLHAFDAKFIQRAGLEIKGEFDDTMVIWNLVDSDSPLGLKFLTEFILGKPENLERKRRLDAYISKVGAGNIAGLCAQDLLNPSHPHLSIIADYCCEDVENTRALYEEGMARLLQLDKKIKGWGYEKTPLTYYYEEARPLERVLFEIEMRGIRLDLSAIEKLKAEAQETITSNIAELNRICARPIALVEEGLFQEKLASLKTERGRGRVRRGEGKLAFSWQNNGHVAELLFEHCGLGRFATYTDKGARKLDRLVLEDMAKSPSIPKNVKRMVELFLEYKKWNKLLSTYAGDESRGILSKAVALPGGEWRIFPTYRQTTGTGRLACIAEGQKIQVPGGEVPIEKIKVGDLVYTYTKDNKLTLRRVKAVIFNGIKECVQVRWQSSGDGRTGELICTGDHKLRHKHKGWIRADALKRHDKLLHVRREILRSGRVRIYSTDRGQELEEQIIKSEFFNAPSSTHIHHIDENKANNNVNNLAVVTNEGHQAIHGRARGWIKRETKIKAPITRFGLLRRLAEAGGRPTFVKGDFQSFITRCAAHNISVREVKQRYSGKQIYLSKGAVMRAAQGRKVHDAARYLGISPTKFKKLCWRFGITYNHSVLSVKTIGPRFVYDLSVDETENFIASEICVHNCSSPNMQNMPRDADVKRFFVPDSPDLVFDDADYSQIELRVAAHESGDKALIDSYLNEAVTGQDTHCLTASRTFGRTILKKDCKEGTEEALLRQVGKTQNFLTIYKGSPYRLQQALLAAVGREWTIEECKDMIDAWFETYPDVARYLQRQLVLMSQRHCVVASNGRMRRLPDIRFKPDGYKAPWNMDSPLTPELIRKWEEANPKEKTRRRPDPEELGQWAYRLYSHAIKAGYNQRIQSMAASLAKKSMIALHRAGFHIANQVHDSLVVARPHEDSAARERMVATMEAIAELKVPLKADVKTVRSFHPGDKA